MFNTLSKLFIYYRNISLKFIINEMGCCVSLCTISKEQFLEFVIDEFFKRLNKDIFVDNNDIETLVCEKEVQYTNENNNSKHKTNDIFKSSLISSFGVNTYVLRKYKYVKIMKDYDRYNKYLKKEMMRMIPLNCDLTENALKKIQTEIVTMYREHIYDLARDNSKDSITEFLMECGFKEKTYSNTDKTFYSRYQIADQMYEYVMEWFLENSTMNNEGNYEATKGENKNMMIYDDFIDVFCKKGCV
jgi:hypothetical protein